MTEPLPINARIAILGAGCAGLTCAEVLRDRGYRHLTVFEAAGRAGGKIQSVPYGPVLAGGRGLFEAGTVFFVPGAGWSLLLDRYGVSHECTRMPAVRIAEIDTGRITHPLRFSGGFGILERMRQTLRFLRMLERFGPAVDREPGLKSHVTAATAVPAGRWFNEQGLAFVRQVLLPIAGGAQFGPLLDRVPAVYVIRLLTFLRRYSLADRLRLAMPQLRAGHQEVWKRAAASHQVRFGEAVTGLRREVGIELETPRGRYEFDAVINTLPAARFLEVADVTEEERDLFSRVRSLDRVVLTARVSGLGEGVFYAPRYGADGVVPPGHPYLLYEVDPGSGLFTFHPYLDGVSVEDAEAAVRFVVGRLGGKVESIEHRSVVRDWFPHFGEEDLRAGIYERLEALQGLRSTWHAGELLAGIGVPHGTEYAMRLVDRIVRPSATAYESAGNIQRSTLSAEHSPLELNVPRGAVGGWRMVANGIFRRAGASRARASAPAADRLADACWIGVLLVGTIAVMTWCFEAPRTCTLLITALACLSLVRFRERADLVAGAVGLVCGPSAEWAATSAGLWHYAHPQLGDLPAWVFPMWWLFPVATRRLALVTGPEPCSQSVGIPLAIIATEIAWLCAWGVASPWLALAGLAVLGAALLAQSRTRADAMAVLCCGVVGPIAEWIPLRAGAFSYLAGTGRGFPIWLPLGYAVFGVALIRLSTAIRTSLEGCAFLKPRLDPARAQGAPTAQGLEQSEAG